MSKREYNKMIKEITKYVNDAEDIDFSMSFKERKDEILTKFVVDVSKGNIKTKKEIIEISDLIKKKVIDVQYFTYF